MKTKQATQSAPKSAPVYNKIICDALRAWSQSFNDREARYVGIFLAVASQGGVMMQAHEVRRECPEVAETSNSSTRSQFNAAAHVAALLGADKTQALISAAVALPAEGVRARERIIVALRSFKVDALEMAEGKTANVTPAISKAAAGRAIKATKAAISHAVAARAEAKAEKKATPKDTPTNPRPVTFQSVGVAHALGLQVMVKQLESFASDSRTAGIVKIYRDALEALAPIAKPAKR